MGRNLQKLALWAVPLLFVAVLFYWAVGNLLVLGLQQDWIRQLGDPYFQKVVWFTIGQALLSTLLCLIVGIPGAYFFYRKQFFGRSFLRALIAVPFVLPTIVVAIALRDYSNYLSPLTLILIAHLFLNYSIVVRTVGGVWQSLDREVEHAAQLDGASRWKTFAHITFPMLRPSIISAATLVFLYCVTSFGIILLLGAGKASTIETEIYFSLTQFLDFKTAAAFSTVQTVITILAFAISKRLGSSVAGIEQVDTSERGDKVSFRDWPIVLITALIVVLLLVLPLAQVLSRFTWQGFTDLAGTGSRAILNISVWQAAGNSLRNILISGCLAMGLGILVSWLLSRTRRNWLELPFLLPMGVSSVVLGFGYLLTFRAGWITIPLVQALLATPLVIRIVHPALLSLGRDYREVALSAGASAWQTWRLVEAPMIATALSSAGVYAALVSLGEFGAAGLLSYGDQATLPVVLYQLISRPGQQNYSMAMTASALLIVSVFAISMSSALIRSRRQSSSFAV
ncbi:MAG: ABC transporter permease [Micrococcales bacterium]